MTPKPHDFTVKNIVSGIVLGTYEAVSEAVALDAWARDAGYAAYSEAIVVEPALRTEIAVVDHDPWLD